MQSKLFPIKTTKQKKNSSSTQPKPNIQLKTDIRAHTYRNFTKEYYIAYMIIINGTQYITNERLTKSKWKHLWMLYMGCDERQK